MALDISGFTQESCQTATAQRITGIHFGIYNLFLFVSKEEITKHFDRIERNIYSKNMDKTYKKELVELFSVCIQSSFNFEFWGWSIFGCNS